MSLRLAVDLGGTRVRVAIVDQDLDILARIDADTDHSSGPHSVIAQIVELASLAKRQAGPRAAFETGMVAAPGPLDASTGTVYAAPNMPGWQEVPLASRLSSSLGIPIQVVNDANAAAMGEYRLGSGRGAGTFVYVTISTGVGGGVIVDGRLLEGPRGTAGELGHITIDRHGEPCTCGNIGCLEWYASGTGIARAFNRELERGEPSAARTPLKVPATAGDVARAAARGDALARRVLVDAAQALGVGLVTCVHLFAPDVIALGGGVMAAGEAFMGPVREYVDRHATQLPGDGVQIVTAHLGDNAGLLGAASLAVGR